MEGVRGWGQSVGLVSTKPFRLPLPINGHTKCYPFNISVATTEVTGLESSNDTRPENIQKLDLSINPTKTEERQKKMNESIRQYDEAFGSLDLEKSFMPMFQLLWYSQMPCFDVEGLTSKAKDEL